MKPKHKVWIFVAIIAIILLGTAGVAWALQTQKSAAKLLVAPKTMLVAIDSAVPAEQAAVLFQTIQTHLQQSGLNAEKATGANAAIVITPTAGPGSTAIAQSQVATPQPLTTAEFVKPIMQDTLFVQFANTPGLSDAAKQQLVADLQKLTKPAESWTLNAVGDIIIGRTVYEQESRRGDYTSSFHKVKELVQNADYTIADAEWTAADGIGYPLAGLSFSSPAKSLDGLTYAGIDAVSLANNHSMNGGVTAFEQMLRNLTARNIGYFGAGHNFAEAHTPYLATVKNTKLAFLGYTSVPGNVEAGANNTGNAFMKITPWFPFTESYVAQMETDIKTAKTGADVVIPFFHWSAEYTHTANEEMRQVAHRAIDAGATVVLGSHPHWVQGIEWYKGHLIIYSLGNFVFDQEQSLKTKQGVMLSAQFSGPNLVGAKFTPIQIEQYYQPHVLDGAPGQQVLNDIYSHSWWPAQ